MKKELRFNKDGKFKILVFGDPHLKVNYDNDELVTKKGADTKALWKCAVEELKPDLIVLMGDLLDANNAEDFRKHILEYTEIIRNNNIPLAYVNGNHDHDHDDTGTVSLNEILSIFQEYENCIAFNATPEIEKSVNYYVNILSSTDDTPKMNMWFIDSNNVKDYDGETRYDWVHDDQIEWYEKTAKSMKQGDKMLPSILFQHIPVPEIYMLTREAKPWEIPLAVRGCKSRSDKFYVLKEGIEGYMGEGPCPPCFNNYQFASWKKTGDVFAAFFGHDHMNDFIGDVDGITLVQNKLSGLFAYTDGCRSGVREVVFDENDLKNFTTRMIRFKDFGLKPQSLGPINSWLSDRWSVNLTIARNAALIAGGAALAGVAVKKIIDIATKG